MAKDWQCALPGCYAATRIGYCSTHRKALHIGYLCIALLAFISGLVIGVVIR